MQKLLKTMVFTQETRGRWIEGGVTIFLFICLFIYDIHTYVFRETEREGERLPSGAVLNSRLKTARSMLLAGPVRAVPSVVAASRAGRCGPKGRDRP